MRQRDGTLDEPEADRLQRHPPELHFRLIRPLGDPPRPDHPAEGESRAPVAFIPAPREAFTGGRSSPGTWCRTSLSTTRKIHINLPQLQKEAKDPRRSKDRGWREAALAIYPFQINLLRVNEGDFVVHRQGPVGRPAPRLAPELPGEQHPQHPLQGPRLPVPDPRRTASSFDEGKGVVGGLTRTSSRSLSPGSTSSTGSRRSRSSSSRSPLARSADMSIKGGVLASEGELRVPRRTPSSPASRPLDRRPAPRLPSHRPRPLPRKTPSSGTSRRPRGRRATTRTSS